MRCLLVDDEPGSREGLAMLRRRKGHEELRMCRDRRGARAHFLNVADSLHSWASDQGRAHDMPMKDKVGPRLPAVLADLWSSS